MSLRLEQQLWKCFIELMTLNWYVRRSYMGRRQRSNWFSIQTTLIECVRKCLLERLGSNHTWSITTQRPAMRRVGFSRYGPDVNKMSFISLCFCYIYVTISYLVDRYFVRDKNPFILHHCNDVIMSVMASQITSLTIVYSTVYSDADQRKH